MRAYETSYAATRAGKRLDMGSAERFLRTRSNRLDSRALGVVVMIERARREHAERTSRDRQRHAGTAADPTLFAEEAD